MTNYSSVFDKQNLIRDFLFLLKGFEIDSHFFI